MTTVNLYHYSASPFTFDPARTYRQAAEMKPRGLWVSAEWGHADLQEGDSRAELIGYGWRDWCLGEEFNLDGLAYRTQIELAPDANVLRLTTPDEIDAFTREFRRPRRYQGLDGLIYWYAVAERYSGIIIAPYQWERRMSPGTLWYYGWDCASGCIWDCAAIVAQRESTCDAM